jgi:hypothetical protein
LGTSFTIKANPNIEERVIVKTGKVSVLAQKQASDRNHTNPNTIIVTPNQEVVYELSKPS